MKVAGFFGLLLLVQFLSAQAYAFSGQDSFKVEQVKPWGEFGFRAIGKGKMITEMRFDCAQTNEMGLVIDVVNNYGKTSSHVMPAAQLGKDKFECQEKLKNYFANIYNKRGLASIRNQERTLHFNSHGGLFSDDANKKTLSFR